MARQVGRELRKHILVHRRKDSKERAERFATVFGPLDAAYPLTDLGNKKNPLDELIYILLSRRSREKQYQRSYRELRRRYRRWAEVLKEPRAQLVRALKPLGLASQRANAIRRILTTIQADFGRTTLYPLKGMTYSEAYHYLRSLPGVNDKSAKCVMLYSLGIAALPVDTHTLRVAKRLGLVQPRSSLFTAPRQLESVVPRESRGRFHVLTVLHGRAICTAQRPKCHVCPLRSVCPSARLPNRSS
jgi:endonuclease III